MIRHGTGPHPAPESGVDHDSTTSARSVEEFAGIGHRLAALLYESLLLLSVFFLGSALFTAAAGMVDDLTSRTALRAVLLALAGVYFVWCWTHGGQTLPMQAWQLRIVDASTGQPPDWKRALKRYLLAAAGVLLGGISFIWALFDRDRQFLHDRLAGTRVIRVPRSG